MSTTGDLIKLARDIILTISELSLPIYKYAHPVNVEGTERFVLNTIPNTQSRAGTMKQNNDLLNVNFYVPKLSDGRIDSARIDTIDGLVQNAFENYNADSDRVGYYYLNPSPINVFNESDKESFINIRVEATYT